MGVPRNWRPSVTFNQQTGIGTAGGYVGEGVAASNLAARILADLVLKKQTPLIKLAWVDDVARRWEPEPIRWIGKTTIQWFGEMADQEELRHDRPSKFWGGLFDRFLS